MGKRSKKPKKSKTRNAGQAQARDKRDSNINKPKDKRYYRPPTANELRDREMVEFEKRTRGLSARDRYFLIMDYLTKLEVLTNQERIASTILLEKTDAEEKGKIDALAIIQLNSRRTHDSVKSLYDSWEGGKRYFMAYKKQGYYSATKFRRFVEDRGFDRPIKFVVDTCIVSEWAAGEKIRTGTFSRDDIARIADRLCMTADEILDLFFTE